MDAHHSINFFERQFQEQAISGMASLNPFELDALPHLRGRVLDFGCGMGNLAVAAAQRGCLVTALDGSATAIGHLRQRARREGLAVEAQLADLRDYAVAGSYDAVVSIGLLMFFDCETAFRRLTELQACVCPGGKAIVNVLIQGTTYMDMFVHGGHCLFSGTELSRRFAGWEILRSDRSDFDAPGQRIKSFATIIAQKPSVTVAPCA